MRNFSSLVLGAASLLAFSGCAPRTITLQSPESSGLHVVGQGEATADPDLATVRVGVQERATSPKVAMDRANETMRRVIEAVRQHGVDPKDVQTADLSMHFERTREVVSPEPPVSRREVSTSQPQLKAEGAKGTSNDSVRSASSLQVSQASLTQAKEVFKGYYVVRNNVSILLRDLDKVGEVIGAAMSAGANQMYGFQLSIEDSSSLQDEARDKAVEAAMKKAQQLANRSGVELGPVLAIRDSVSSRPVPYAGGRTMMAAQSESVPIERGQLAVSQTVEVTFSLGKDRVKKSPE